MKNFYVFTALAVIFYGFAGWSFFQANHLSFNSDFFMLQGALYFLGGSGLVYAAKDSWRKARTPNVRL